MEKQDILNRGQFIEDLFQMVENISVHKSSTCFALNGKWGCGKSFVLDMFQEKLDNIISEETKNNKYFVIRYNSWGHDYYDEPLVAIVASLLDSIEEKTSLFPDSKRKSELLGIVKAAGVALLSIGNTAIKEATGVDVKKAGEILFKGKKEGDKDYEHAHEYDMYFAFKKVIKKLADVLEKIAEEYTIVFLVDELDRCMPAYAIKVLKRLHHLTEGKANIITIIALDKDKLQYSIKQIFGFNEPEKYLEKFISFEVKLDYGKVSEAITAKHDDYIALFDEEKFPFSDSVEECWQALFKDVDVRTQEQLVKKAMLAHKLLYGEEKKDYSFMCMEILLAVMICVYKDESCLNEDVSVAVDDFGKIFNIYNRDKKETEKPAFAEFFKEKFQKVFFRDERDFPDEPINRVLCGEISLYGAIIYTWYWMHKRNDSVVYSYYIGEKYEIIANNRYELKKFAEMMKMMS